MKKTKTITLVLDKKHAQDLLTILDKPLGNDPTIYTQAFLQAYLWRELVLKGWMKKSH